MILVRQIFQTEWGKSHDVATMFMQSGQMIRRILGPDTHVRILTDLVGRFNTVVQEIEVESLAKWEGSRAAIFADPEFQRLTASSGPVPFRDGWQEIYTIEGAL